MSLILDALNRSRESREDMPGLASRHGPDEYPSRGRQVQWGLWSALLLALLVIGWLLLDRGNSQAPPLVAAGDSQTSQSGPGVVAPPPPPAVVTGEELPADSLRDPVPDSAPELASDAATAPAQPRQNTAAEVSALYGSADAAEAAPMAAATQPAVEPDLAAEPLPPAPAPEAPKPAAVASSPRVDEQPVDIEALVSQAEQQLADARLDEHPAPLLAGLSQQSKDRIPTILYQRHDYSGRPGESSVVLNGKTLRPGANAAAGVRVEEILPDSVVLSHQGEQFRLRALNSWVNL